MRRGAFLWISALLLLAVPAQSATIFSSLIQPGNQYGPDSIGVGAVPVPGLFLYSASNFTPGATYRLNDLVLPLAVVSGVAAIDVLLYSDTGNVPGALIESFHVTGFPVPGPTALTPMFSVLHPTLNAGTQYWVAVTGGSPTTFGMWGLTLFNGSGVAGGAQKNFLNGIDQGWIRNPGTRDGALLVEGDLLVPEPASILLMTLGALVGWASRPRRASRRALGQLTNRQT